MTEREAIVAWLRKEALADDEWGEAISNYNDQVFYAGSANGLRKAADAIEAGQHLENKDG